MKIDYRCTQVGLIFVLFWANYFNLCAIKAVLQRPNILTIFCKNIKEKLIILIKTYIRIQITHEMWKKKILRKKIYFKLRFDV